MTLTSNTAIRIESGTAMNSPASKNRVSLSLNIRPASLSFAQIEAAKPVSVPNAGDVRSTSGCLESEISSVSPTMPAIHFAMIREAGASFDWRSIPPQQRRGGPNSSVPEDVTGETEDESAQYEKPADRNQRALPFLRSHVSLV